MKIFGLGCLLCALAATGSQANVGDPAQLCDRAALLAAQAHDVPAQVMLAITRVETGQSHAGGQGPWPWTINLGGEGHWFPTADEAVAFADSQMQAGTTNMDIGCFQLNLRWHAEGFASLNDMFDPMANADYAAGFLTRNYEEKGNWVDAVAAYHSSTPEFARIYVEKVEAVLADLTPQMAGDMGTEGLDEVVPHVNGFPLLQPGAPSDRSASNGSLVSFGAGLAPLFAAMP